MTVVIPHALDVHAAFSKLKKGAEVLSAQNAENVKGFSAIWDKNTGKLSGRIRGVNVSAGLRVIPGKVIVEGNLPLVFRLFKSQIAEMIKQNITNLLTES